MKDDIEILDKKINLTRKKMKTITMRVKQNGDICVSAPKYVSLKVIKDFVESKVDWIKSQLDKQKQSLSELQFENDKEILIFNYPYKIKIEYGVKRNKIKLVEQTLIMFVKNNSSQKDLLKLFDSWSRKVLNNILPKYFEKWSLLTGLKINKFTIRNMNTRWGSCNVKAHTISINVQIIQKPIECLDYLVLHEIAHIYEPSHNQRFKNFLSLYMPDWKKRRNLLKNK